MSSALSPFRSPLSVWVCGQVSVGHAGAQPLWMLGGWTWKVRPSDSVVTTPPLALSSELFPTSARSEAPFPSKSPTRMSPGYRCTVALSPVCVYA